MRIYKENYEEGVEFLAKAYIEDRIVSIDYQPGNGTRSPMLFFPCSIVEGHVDGAGNGKDYYYVVLQHLSHMGYAFNIHAMKVSSYIQEKFKSHPGCSEVLAKLFNDFQNKVKELVENKKWK